MGTAACMSPEQAKGKPVDKRTDIWAFGCVLYECLTGKRAFGGETVTNRAHHGRDLSLRPHVMGRAATRGVHPCDQGETGRRAHGRLREAVLVQDTVGGQPVQRRGAREPVSIAPQERLVVFADHPEDIGPVRCSRPGRGTEQPPGHPDKFSP